MKRRITALVVLLIVGTALLEIYWPMHNNGRECIVGINEPALRSFLESQYVPEAGLLRAAVKVYPDNETIYVANDNLLAARALSILNSPLGGRIQKNLDENYSGGWNGKVDVLSGRPVEGFFCSETEVVGEIYSQKFHSKFTVKYERANLSCRMDDWQDYADLLAYAALDETLNGDRTKTMKFYHSLLGMWDGYGFRDKAFTGVYQTYKCALFIYLHRALGKPREGQEIYERCVKIISHLQAQSGGIITGYRIESGKIIPVGDANTETSSMVALALYSDFPKRSQT